MIDTIVIAIASAVIGAMLERRLSRGERQRQAEDSTTLVLILRELKRQGKGVEVQRNSAGEPTGVRVVQASVIAGVQAHLQATAEALPRQEGRGQAEPPH